MEWNGGWIQFDSLINVRDLGGMPTQDGSYTLALTVSGGKPSVEWEVNA